MTADRAPPPGSLDRSTLCNNLPHGLRGSDKDCVTRFDCGVAREHLGLSWVTLLSPWCGPSAYAARGWLVWSSQDGTSHVWFWLLAWAQTGLLAQLPPEASGESDFWLLGTMGGSSRWPFMTPPQKSRNTLLTRFEGQVVHGPLLSREVRPGRCGCAFDLPHVASHCVTSQGPWLLVNLDILLRAPPKSQSGHLADSNVHFSIQNFPLQIQSNSDLNYF